MGGPDVEGERIVRILMVSSEMAPVASTGDLGDAVGALARGLARRGHEVLVVMPEYGSAGRPMPQAEGLGHLGDFPTAAGSRAVAAWLAPSTVPHLRVVRLRCPPLYDRPGLYGEPEDYGDNPDRFWVLNLGAVAAARRLNWIPDIAHGHDWHCGWLPAVVRSQSDLQQVRTVYTGYDLRMVGLAPLEWAQQLGVVGDLLKPEGIEYFGRLSFAKVGLRFADVVAMSKPEGSEPSNGLDGVVQARGAAVTRIPRSLDAFAQDPASDLGIPARFSADELDGKSTCKRRLQAAMGFEIDPHAIVVLVDRDPAALGAQGPKPDRRVQWLPLEGLSAGMRHLAVAGADALLEIAQDPWSAMCRTAERYGLATIIPAGPDIPEDAYVFDEARPQSIGDAVTRLAADYSDVGRWQAAVQERLRRDPERGISRYETLFRQVVGLPVGPPIPWAVPELSECLQALGR